jgi:hypothetical protein
LKRALHLVNGGDPAAFPPHETVVFDQCHLHPDARGIYWDLRDYYRVLDENGQDYPWLIVPLFSKEVRPGKLNHNAIRTLTKRHAGTSSYGDLETPDGLKFGVNNNAAVATHGYARGNWAKSYEFFGIGDADIRTYKDRGWIQFSDHVCFVPLSIVPQNSVVKPGKPDSNPYRTDSMEFPHGIRIPWNFYGIRIFMDSMDFFPQLVKSAPQQPWPKKYDMDF